MVSVSGNLVKVLQVVSQFIYLERNLFIQCAVFHSSFENRRTFGIKQSRDHVLTFVILCSLYTLIVLSRHEFCLPKQTADPQTYVCELLILENVIRCYQGIWDFFKCIQYLLLNSSLTFKTYINYKGFSLSKKLNYTAFFSVLPYYYLTGHCANGYNCEQTLK